MQSQKQDLVEKHGDGVAETMIDEGRRGREKAAQTDLSPLQTRRQNILSPLIKPCLLINLRYKPDHTGAQPDELAAVVEYSITVFWMITTQVLS